MEIVRALVASTDAATLFAHVDELEAYRSWMPLVHDVEREPEAEPPAWTVELRATVGPFARSKRLRMVRTRLVPDELVVFERVELDGRDHSSWILRAELEPVATGGAIRDGDTDRTRLTMTLRYGGSLWSGAVLQRVLDDQVERGSAKLVELVTERPTR